MKPLEKAIAHAGGITKLAKQLSVRQSVVSNWKARGTLIDALYCAQIEQITDGLVTRKMLRPVDWMIIWPELNESLLTLTDRNETSQCHRLIP